MEDEARRREQDEGAGDDEVFEAFTHFMRKLNVTDPPEEVMQDATTLL